jgi:hypothetical protein
MWGRGLTPGRGGALKATAATSLQVSEGRTKEDARDRASPQSMPVPPPHHQLPGKNPELDAEAPVDAHSADSLMQFSLKLDSPDPPVSEEMPAVSESELQSFFRRLGVPLPPVTTPLDKIPDSTLITSLPAVSIAPPPQQIASPASSAYVSSKRGSQSKNTKDKEDLEGK